ncbi:MAG: hypothetical protein NPIRA04_22010 [Nitrospirales bacterium]|nr:MAG: hypothetical protein NPIRA04_22010 [Nitrospirales bacterium]
MNRQQRRENEVEWGITERPNPIEDKFLEGAPWNNQEFIHYVIDLFSEKVEDFLSSREIVVAIGNRGVNVR